jgi:hypothetical protein
MSENRPGLGVDSRGGAVVDPTQNVLDLVEAKGKATDAAIIAAVHRLDDLREEKYKHLHELQTVELKRIDEVLKLRVDFTMQLAVAEAKRIDANLAVVESTGRARTDAVFQGLAQITERVATVEKFQYEASGRSRVADPIMDNSLREIKGLLVERAQLSGQGQGMSMIVGYILAAIAALSSGVAIVLSLQGAFRPAVGG